MSIFKPWCWLHLCHKKIIVTKKEKIMRTIEKTDCPNCWGYQTYDEQNQEQQICTCN